MSLSEDASLSLWRFIESPCWGSHCSHGTTLSLTWGGSRCSRMWSACHCGHIACTYWAGLISRCRGYECCLLHTIWCRACHLLMTLWFSISPDMRSAVVLLCVAAWLEIPVSRIQRNMQPHEAWLPAVKDKPVDVSVIFFPVPFHLSWWFRIKNCMCYHWKSSSAVFQWHVTNPSRVISAPVLVWEQGCVLCQLRRQCLCVVRLQLSWHGVVLVLLLFKWKPFVVLQFPNTILTLKTYHGRMWSKWMGWNTLCSSGCWSSEVPRAECCSGVNGRNDLWEWTLLL